MVQLPDLHELPEGHPPSPYNHPLVVINVGDGTLPEGLTVRAVGWIEELGFPTGSIPDKCIRSLVNATPQAIFWDGMRGIHTCSLCHKTLLTVRWKRRTISLKGAGHYLVRNGDIVYMAPSLLLHYIVDHEYCPPQEFLDALIGGRFLTEQDLVITWR